MGEQQQMARVDVDLETWQTFRIEAIRRGRSIADWLGELVEREVARIDGTAGRAGASPVQSEPQGAARGEVGEGAPPTGGHSHARDLRCSTARPS